MRELRTQIEIDAPASRVWQILTDLEGYTKWNPFIVAASGEVREGTKLSVLLSPPGSKPMTFKPTVTKVEQIRGFRWLGHLAFPGLFDGKHIFEIEALETGGVLFVHREEFGGMLVPLLWKKLDSQTRRGFEAMNRALKELAESMDEGEDA